MSLHVILTAIGYFVFSACAGAMLPPLPGQERTFCGWLYRVAQALAANATQLAEARLALHANAELYTHRSFGQRLIDGWLPGHGFRRARTGSRQTAEPGVPDEAPARKPPIH